MTSPSRSASKGPKGDERSSMLQPDDDLGDPEADAPEAPPLPLPPPAETMHLPDVTLQ